MYLGINRFTTSLGFFASYALLYVPVPNINDAYWNIVLFKYSSLRMLPARTFIQDGHPKVVFVFS